MTIDDGSFVINSGDSAQVILQSHVLGWNSIPVKKLEKFLRLKSGTIEKPNAWRATQGTAIKKILKVKSGDRFSFKRKFMCGSADRTIPDEQETCDDQRSFAFVVIVNKLDILATAFDPMIVGRGGFTRMSGFKDYAHVFNKEGNYMVGIGVVDAVNPTLSATLLVSNFHVQ